MNLNEKNVSIRYVRINGNDRTRNYVIEKELQQAYKARTLGTVIAGLEEAMFGLQGLDIFEEIHFEIDDVDDDNNNTDNNNDNANPFHSLNTEDLNQIDLIVVVKEKRRFGLKMMLESDGHTSAESTATMNLRNVLGSAENGQVSIGTDTNFSSILQGNVTWPRFYNFPCSMKIFGKDTTNQHWRTSGYNENVKSLGLSFLQHGGDGWSLTFQDDQRDIVPTTILKSNTILAATKAIANDCQPTRKASVKLNYTKDTRSGNKFVPRNKSYLFQTAMELAGLGNTGDVQFAKAGGLFQYWIPLFGGSGRNNTNDLSSTFTWLPMLTFGLSAEIVTPLPNMINDITNTTKQQQNRIRINDRVFLNNELMLRGFQRRGIGPRADKLTTNPTDLLHSDSKQPPAKAGFALGANGQFLASARLEFPFPIPALHHAGCRLHLFSNCGNSLPLQEMYKLSNWKKSMRATAGAGFVFGLPICRLEINYMLWSKKFQGDQCSDIKQWKWGISATFL